MLFCIMYHFSVYFVKMYFANFFDDVLAIETYETESLTEKKALHVFVKILHIFVIGRCSKDAPRVFVRKQEQKVKKETVLKF